MTACRSLPVEAVAAAVDAFCELLERIKRLTEARGLEAERVHVLELADDLEDAGLSGQPGFVAALIAKRMRAATSRRSAEARRALMAEYKELRAGTGRATHEFQDLAGWRSFGQAGQKHFGAGGSYVGGTSLAMGAGAGPLMFGGAAGEQAHGAFPYAQPARGGSTGGYYGPSNTGSGRGRGRGRGHGSSSAGRGGAPICRKCSNAGLPAAHSHTHCPQVQCNKCGTMGHVKRVCPN